MSESSPASPTIGEKQSLGQTAPGGVGRIPAAVYWLSGLTIGVALCTVVAILFLFPTPTVSQYRMMIFFMSFALSSISALLFAATVEIKTKVGAVSATLGGAAALWIGAALVMSVLYPEQPIVEDRNRLVAATDEVIASRVKASAMYQLSLNLIFPADDLPQDPRNVKVDTYVTRSGDSSFTNDKRYGFTDVIPGVGGIVLNIDKLKEKDHIRIVTTEGRREWTSFDVVVLPPTNMVLNKSRQIEP